ncbi:hypothetical protein NYR97_11575 [Xanthomonas hydrangeae]|uniref:Uncharacterized protein n=1 Tax=Xanthomonas hydrangeae TaxID=2775159 RepID=A0AAU0B980_9XANT|nr:hypothetical protein [Xanthomonas hydrangeae]WOB47933.1 hypothetical protein NYR97_11575 [Xanthomonas hydrangeae]
MKAWNRFKRSSPWRVARYFFIGTAAFLPAVIFLRFAQWNGIVSDDRWMLAFQISSPFACVYLLAAALRRSPANRLVLATNLYLLGGGIMSFFHYWPGLAWYGRLREAAVMLLVVVVGVMAILFTRSGFIAVQYGDPQRVRRDSLLLLAAAIAGVAVAYACRGNPFVAVVVPMMLLSLLGHHLRSAYEIHAVALGNVDEPA